jgi:hypothetical protein
MMSMGERNQFAQHHPQFTSPMKKCPYYPGAVTAPHGTVFTLPIAEAVFAALVSHPSGLAQTESKYRISRDRSRQKRGPPTLFLL